MKKIFLTIVVALQLFQSPVAHATSLDYNSFLENFQQSVADESQQVDSNGDGVTLPTFTEDTTEGAGVIVATIKRFLDFLKLVVTPLAILFMTVMAVRMVSAARDNEEVTTQAKNYITYCLYGLMFIFVSDSVVSSFFGAEGDVLRGGTAGAEAYGQSASTLFRGIYSFIEMLIGAIAVFMLVMAGMRYVAGSYDDDQIAKAKKQIQWSLVGLILVGLSEYVVKGILFQNQGTKIGFSEAKQLMADFTNFLAGTMGTISFVSLLYAGMLYVGGVQNEDNVAKAKKIIMWSLGGIVIAVAAFAFTNTIVNLDSSS